MLPLVDKPIIQYGVEEALHSGIQNIIIVTGRGKTAIEDHFDVSFELEYLLESRDSGPAVPECFVLVCSLRSQRAVARGRVATRASGPELRFQPAKGAAAALVLTSSLCPSTFRIPSGPSAGLRRPRGTITFGAQSSLPG